MTTSESKPQKPRSFTADSPFSLIGILISMIIGLLVGGVLAVLLLF